MADDYAEALDTKQSEYNDAKLQTFRLHFLWVNAHDHARAGKLKEWNWDLDRVWMEIGSDADDDFIKQFDNFNNEIAKLGLDRAKLYKILMGKEMMLRKLQNKLGLGKKYADPLEEYMD